MIYHIILPYIKNCHIANLMHYVTVRCALAGALSFLIFIIFGNQFIQILKSFQAKGQPIRSFGPETHLAKKNTPTMGGIMIIGSILLSSFLFCNLTNRYVLVTLFTIFAFGLIGFFDDYNKLKKNHHQGLRGKFKLLVDFIICGIIYYALYDNIPNVSCIYFPFFKNLYIDISYLYLIFMSFVITGSSNAVNLTDGLDGLVSVPVSIVASCFGIIAYLAGNVIFSNYLYILHIPQVSELSIICSAIAGSCLGFLWYNAKPAELFMGDTGSLPLGAALGVISVITKHEVLLAIAGGLFVIEALSVIIQVGYFRYTGGKRIFRMAPIHHHFEKLGWPETKVVVRFWVISIVFAVIALSSFKIR